MRKIMVLCSMLCSTTVLAIDADFSKSFVVPEKSTINKMTLGGIDAAGKSYSVDFSLQEDLSLTINNAVVQDSVSEKLEQSLRNTTWKGKYTTKENIYTTTLTIFVVQDGFVGGEIIHSQSFEEGDRFLHTRVTGDIVTQFEIEGSFVDEDRMAPGTLEKLMDNTPHRQLIRVKRMRTLEFRNKNDGSDEEKGYWNSNREYRLILEDGLLTGKVGVPSSTVGTDDATEKDYTISLVQQQ